MLRGIRTRLLGLVVATVVPFTALIGGGLWNQWFSDSRFLEMEVDGWRFITR
jgi:hypothetical protein